MNWLTGDVCVSRLVLASYFIVLSVAYVWRTATVRYRINKTATDTIRAIDASLALNRATLDVARQLLQRLSAAKEE